MKTRQIDLSLLALILVLVLLISGCSMPRKINKTENKALEQRSATINTTESLEDKTLTTITKKIDTTIVTPGTKFYGESTGTSIETIIDGDTLKANYDKITNVIRAQFTSAPKKNVVLQNITTMIQANVKRDVSTQIDSSSVVKTESTTKIKETKTNYIIFGLGALILLLVILYFLNKRFKVVSLPF